MSRERPGFSIYNNFTWSSWGIVVYMLSANFNKYKLACACHPSVQSLDTFTDDIFNRIFSAQCISANYGGIHFISIWQGFNFNTRDVAIILQRKI